MASMFKKTDVELELIRDVDMLLMIKRGIRGGICHAILRYAKVNNKYMKDYKKMKKNHFYNRMIQTPCMVGECQNHYLLMVLIGWKIFLK